MVTDRDTFFTVSILICCYPIIKSTEKIVKVTYLWMHIERYTFFQFVLDLICYLRVIGT